MCYYGDWAELCATMAGTVSSKSLVRDSWSDGCARYILGKVFATGSGLHAIDRILNDVFFLFFFEIVRRFRPFRFGGRDGKDDRAYSRVSAPNTSPTLRPFLSLLSIISVFGPVANAPRHMLYSSTVLVHNASSILVHLSRLPTGPQSSPPTRSSSRSPSTPPRPHCSLPLVSALSALSSAGSVGSGASPHRRPSPPPPPQMHPSRARRRSSARSRPCSSAAIFLGGRRRR